MIPILAIATLILFAALWLLWSRQLTLRREAYIRTFDLPRGLFEQLRKRRPELGLKDCQLVAHGLRQFFLAHLKSGRKYVSMPSQVADDLWHEFILYTWNYQAFCGKAFGKFLHHTPAVALSSSGLDNAGLRRVWWHTCLEDNINPRKSTRLSLLFALDAKLGIPDGFRYAADCKALRERQGASGPDSLSTAPAFSAARQLMVQWTASGTREAVRGLAAMELTMEVAPEVPVEAGTAEAVVAVVAAAVDLAATLSNVSPREREY